MNKIMQLLIATKNTTKVARLKAILESLNANLDLISLNNFAIEEPDEPYESFAENALHKAQYYANLTGLNTLSEDSGLCINALQGFPGVRTKEFKVAAGGLEPAFAELFSRLANHQDRTAYFICSGCIVLPATQEIITAEGRLNGNISTSLSEAKGFDFERIFIPQGHDKTMAELADVDKNNISHRFKAIKSLYEQWQSIA